MLRQHPVHGMDDGNDASMAASRGAHTATLLTSGRVLVVGGEDGTRPPATAEAYVP